MAFHGDFTPVVAIRLLHHGEMKMGIRLG